MPLEEEKLKKTSKLRIFIVIFGIILLVLGYLAYDAWNFINTPASIESKEVILKIEEGATLTNITKILYENGLISSKEKFQVYVRAQDKETGLKAGTFAFNTSFTTAEILDMLVEGRSILQRLIVREGLPWWSIAELLEEEGFCKAEDFSKIIHDPEFLKKYNIPFDSAEGFLYPETYFMPLSQEMNADAALFVATVLVEMFWEQTDALWEEANIDVRADPDKLKELVILASIVERETRLKDERPRVAGVYANRMDINMPLQADPTVIYGLGSEFSGSLYRRHLNDDNNIYNTYRHNGLPPGPICSPSLESLIAATYPEEHSYLYFVASGLDASHVFSKNLNDHNRAVRAYRKNLGQ